VSGRVADYVGSESASCLKAGRGKSYFYIILDKETKVCEDMVEVEGTLFVNKDRYEIDGLIGPVDVNLYVKSRNGRPMGNTSIEYHGSLDGLDISGSCMTIDTKKRKVLSERPFSMHRHIDVSMN
jgi:hypothetical protein